MQMNEADEEATAIREAIRAAMMGCGIPTRVIRDDL
jgi:hypothetical protein